ncbi:hypothetical protein CANARDRAFT_109721 [[Candida] arabinofermentans NRRL YB-2248]|uniref:Dynactin subunit 4 n=1 Tax=[Candida] arabinofermentans NRRL YB-2248 TaxID=983967 RepID=A0A1E4STI4_9ASCO|nr:hypothetical protein CANARDRAFT_109721 [[Candida] arabinofermentans NRRL YB-2248]
MLDHITETRIFCPCSEKNLDWQDYPETLFDPSVCHRVSSLHFCPTCKSVKCFKCLEFETICKFCPRCYATVPNGLSYCNKSCFNCPRCHHYLNISAKTHMSSVNDKKGRSFTFTCTNCLWNLETGIISKPQALTSIVRKLDRNPVHTQFSQLKEFYVRQYEALKLQEQGSKIKHDLLARFSAIELASLTQRQNPVGFSESELSEEEELNEMRSRKSHIGSQNANDKLPLSQELSEKRSLRCKACRSVVLMPDSDPLSTRLEIPGAAADQLPSLLVTGYRNQPEPFRLKHPTARLILTLSNPLSESMDIKISTFEQLDSLGKPLKKDTKMEQDLTSTIGVHITCSEIQLGCKLESSSKPENYVKLIPTVKLTSRTKISRIELMRRDPDNLRNITWSNDEHWFDSTDSSGSVLDRGVNWSSVGINLSVGEGIALGTKINIPLFVGVTTKTSSYGMWTFLNAGEVVK